MDWLFGTKPPEPKETTLQDALAGLKRQVVAIKNQALIDAYTAWKMIVDIEISPEKMAEHERFRNQESYADSTIEDLQEVIKRAGPVSTALTEKTNAVQRTGAPFDMLMAMKGVNRNILQLYQIDASAAKAVRDRKEPEATGDKALAENMRARLAALGRGGKRKTKKRKQSKRKRRHTRK
jgi:hypothetical protein